MIDEIIVECLAIDEHKSAKEHTQSITLDMYQFEDQGDDDDEDIPEPDVVIDQFTVLLNNPALFGRFEIGKRYALKITSHE